MASIALGTSRFVFVWLVGELTEWNPATAILGIVIGLPPLLLSAWAGSLADRVSARTLGVGLFAAGMTSAITAPLAAAYAVAGAAGWERDLTSPRVRAVWIAVLATGVIFSLTGIRPVAAILFAQAANGILLPVVAAFLLVTVNDSELMGTHRNSWRSNLIGGIVVLVAVLLGARALLTVSGVL